MRTEEQLISLIRDLRTWFRADFQSDYDPAVLQSHLIRMRDARIYEFLKKRVGHISDADFCSLVKLFIQDPVRAPVEPPPVVAPPVAKPEVQKQPVKSAKKGL